MCGLSYRYLFFVNWNCLLMAAGIPVWYAGRNNCAAYRVVAASLPLVTAVMLFQGLFYGVHGRGVVGQLALQAGDVRGEGL